MHFHAVMKPLGLPPIHLGGPHALPFPGDAPAFATIEAAEAAVVESAFDQWGPHAEAQVDLSFRVGKESGHQYAATALWSDRTRCDGATWILISCHCHDGTLAAETCSVEER